MVVTTNLILFSLCFTCLKFSNLGRFLGNHILSTSYDPVSYFNSAPFYAINDDKHSQKSCFMFLI